jgi:hypothetical protein
MIFFYTSCLIITVSLLLVTYIQLFRSRKLFDSRFSMTITFVSTIVYVTFLSMITSFIFKGNFSTLSIYTGLVAIIIGISFGALGNFQSIITGVSSGIIASLMGGMVGAVILNPSLCSIPNQANALIEKNMLIFSIFSVIILLLSTLFIRHSFKN